ncbi:helix-turn-helix domain-containing protein [Pseudoflavonifractor sp. MSJ-30]|mgnify:CR=1 FL=1|uniref:helix-turn-helix domain-containing protein n=1 Tax=Pseudoflavonifractor sp. MSJ-30 TaxID=2841525 RepID=UPI001C12457A|nr:helix-turn-helix transcriptional regulator [Pseudoflavonifractor sp. MSJ-30]MBU5452866.1 helix-turn-helix domain-containing protein [Pseudoflavonifractor sp. MSJ-30]
MKPEYQGLYEKFGLNVVYYRKRKRLTQMQLAELVDIDRSHISAIELGRVGVSFDVIFKLCEVLEITPKQLFDFRE